MEDSIFKFFLIINFSATKQRVFIYAKGFVALKWL